MTPGLAPRTLKRSPAFAKVRIPIISATDDGLNFFEVDGKVFGEGQSPKKHIAKDLAADTAWALLTAEAGGSSS